MRRLGLLALLGAAGCFSPGYSDSTRCSPSGACPSGRSCSVDGFCLLSQDGAVGDDGGDAGESLDAGASLQVTPTSNDFGTIVRGRASAPVTFNVSGGDALGAPLAVQVTGAGAGSFVLATDGCSTMALATCSFDVVFQPSVEGTLAATVQVTQGASMGTVAVSGVAVGVGLLTITPISEDYGDVVEGSSQVIGFQVTNTGSTATGALAVALSGAGRDQFKVVSDAMPDCVGISLAAAASCTQRVAFEPTRPGSALASLSVGGNPGGTAVATLRGNGVGPAKVVAAPAMAEFGIVTTGTNTTLSIDLTNTGGLATGAIMVSITGADAGMFSVMTNGCSMPLAPQGSCTLVLRFAPVAPAAMRQATLVVNPTGASPVMVPLSGMGILPGALMANPTSLGFGVVSIGSDVMQTVTVTNTGGSGTGPITTSVGGANPGDFPILTNTCMGQSLAPSATCMVALRFAPTVGGSRSASLSIVASPGGGASVPLGGTGQMRLTVTRTGTGMGSISGGAVSCPTTCDVMVTTPSITLLASPDPNSTFSGWTGCDSLVGTQCIINANTAMRSANAVFLLRTHPVTVIMTGMGRVTSTPPGIDCPGTCTASFAQGSTVTLTAMQLMADQPFQMWGMGDNCDGLMGFVCSFPVSAPSTENPQFKLPCHLVINEVSPMNGGFGRFIELYNPCMQTLFLQNHQLVYRDGFNMDPVTAPDDRILKMNIGIQLNPNQFWVIGDSGSIDDNFDQPPPSNSSGAFAVRDPMNQVIDAMAFGGSGQHAFSEGGSWAQSPSFFQALSRIPNGQDTDMTQQDFQQRGPTPRMPNM